MARAALYDFALGYIVIAGRRGPLGRRLGGEREPSTTAVDRRSDKWATRTSADASVCAPVIPQGRPVIPSCWRAIVRMLSVTGSTLIAVAGLLSAGSVSAFHPPTGVLSPLPRESRAFAVLQARPGFSAAERAARRAARAAAEQQKVAAPQAAQQPPAQAPPAAQYYQAPGPAPAADALDAIGRPAAESPQCQSVDEMLAVVLSEFVQSDYARECCNYCNIMPLDYGQVEGMFESLQRVDTKLVVKMKRSFEQRSVQLLDKLAKHLRARLPPGSIQRMEYVVGSPPSTRIIII